MKIYIRRNPASLINEIFFVQHPKMQGGFGRGDVLGFFNIKETGEVIVEEKVVNDNSALTPKYPTMILDEHFTRELVQAFLEYAAQEGIENNSESHFKGKLEAQSEHLKDLRKMLKL